MPLRRYIPGRGLVASVCALVVIAAAGTADASGLDLFGAGARGGALAGTAAASPSGHSAVYYNGGAGLAFDTEPSFAIGFQSAFYDMQVNGDDRSIDDAPSMVIGFNVPLPLGGWLTDRIALGMTLLLPTTSLLQADIPRPADPRFVVVENRAQTVSIAGAMGIRVFDWLAIGAGALALAELIGAIDVAPNETGRIGASVRDELVADYAAFAGVVVRLDWFTFSATFRDESSARFELPIDVSLGESFSIPIPTLDITGTAQFDPRQVALDVGFVLPHRIFLGAGVTWKQWSAFANPIVYTAVPEDFPEQPEPSFSDIWIPRLGAEWVAELPYQIELATRAGFAWEPSPVPEQTGLHNYLDAEKATTSAGLGVRWAGIRLDAAFQWQTMIAREHAKDDSRLEEELPDDVELEANTGYPSVAHGGDLYFFSVEAGVSF